MPEYIDRPSRTATPTAMAKIRLERLFSKYAIFWCFQESTFRCAVAKARCSSVVYCTSNVSFVALVEKKNKSASCINGNGR